MKIEDKVFKAYKIWNMRDCGDLFKAAKWLSPMIMNNSSAHHADWVCYTLQTVNLAL